MVRWLLLSLVALVTLLMDGLRPAAASPGMPLALAAPCPPDCPLHHHDAGATHGGCTCHPAQPEQSTSGGIPTVALLSGLIEIGPGASGYHMAPSPSLVETYPPLHHTPPRAWL